MQKKNFITLVLGVMGTLLFGIGMCMCLLPEWNAFQPGVAVSVTGALVLLILMLVRRKMDGKPAVKLNLKAVAFTLYAIFSTLVLGSGMCMILVWDMMLYGILVGVAGILLLLLLIPMIKGLHD